MAVRWKHSMLQFGLQRCDFRWTFVEGVAVVVHGSRWPSEEAFEACLDALDRRKNALKGVLVYSLGRGPKPLQRKRLVQRVVGTESLRVALVTRSLVARKILGATSWLRVATRTRVRAFDPVELDHALDHLRLDGPPRAGVEVELRRLRRSLPGGGAGR